MNNKHLSISAAVALAIGGSIAWQAPAVAQTAALEEIVVPSHLDPSVEIIGISPDW